jgi:hypothetical protein
MHGFSNGRTGENVHISQASLNRAQILLEQGACSAATLPTGVDWPVLQLVSPAPAFTCTCADCSAYG